MNTYHIPVLRDEVLAGLQIHVGKKYIDATVGGGGHGWEIVKRGGILLGIDTDIEAVEHVKMEFSVKNSELRGKENWKIKQGNFRNIQVIATREGFDKADGILFDLGVSSHQLDEAQRGFSYRFDHAPLDLRMNQKEGKTAKEILTNASEEELYEIFAKYGEEERSRAIAHALLGARSVRPIETVDDIVQAVAKIVPDYGERYGVLSRIFQALRIVVNDELGALREGLKGAGEILKPEGRIAVISFHSLEDRIVKQFLNGPDWRLITKKPILANRIEQMENKRSRSAKLRIAVKR